MRFQPHCGIPGQSEIGEYSNLAGVPTVEHPVPKMDSGQLPESAVRMNETGQRTWHASVSSPQCFWLPIQLRIRAPEHAVKVAGVQRGVSCDQRRDVPHDRRGVAAANNPVRQRKRPPTKAALSFHFGAFFRQFAAEQYLASFARSVPIFEQVPSGHLTVLPDAPIFPWAFASPALNKNGNTPRAAIATILSILTPNRRHERPEPIRVFQVRPLRTLS